MHVCVHACSHAAASSWMCLDTIGYGWVGTLAMLERAACMLQHGELGRPFSRQLGPAGSRWVGQISWVNPVGFHSRTFLFECLSIDYKVVIF
eukprot:COSAG01_NODE_2656_length_7304_cov_56.354615_9_plen_92_part_00